MIRARSTLAALGLLVVIPACDPFGSSTGDGNGPGPSDPTTDLAKVALQAHDQIRSSAVPTPTPALPGMRWSDEVQAVAAQWASHCVYQHNAGRGNLGENIAASSPGYWPSIAEVAQEWASEAAFYDYASNSCEPGKVCGHYTQIVWRNSTLLGCAYARCNGNSPFPGVASWDFWVCDYSPPGNWIGERPY